MSQLNEKLLRAWITLSTNIVNDRVVDELSYNEALICNILSRQQFLTPEQPITATDLCLRTKMLKSQMNRTLTHLEEKGLICRQRSEHDRRQIYVFMNMDHAGTYQRLHQRVLDLVDGIIEQIGEERAAQAVQLLDDIAAAADKLLNHKKTL